MAISIPLSCQMRSDSPYVQPGEARDRIGIDYLWYGINQYSMQANLPTLATYVPDLGVGIVRFDIYWYFIEPSRGNFDWEKTDAAVAALPPDTQILFTVYCTAPWAIKERRDPSNNIITSIMPPTAPVDFEDYRGFVRSLAARYKGRVGYYQIENEVYGSLSFWMGTRAEYLQLLQTAYGAVKGADPAARVLPAGIPFAAIDVTEPIAPAYQAAFDFVDLVYSSGKDSFDIADVHLYYTLDSIPDRLQWLRDLMTAKGYSKPVWASEIGGLDSRAYMDYADSAEQSIDLVKRYVLAFAGSADKVFWLSVHKAKDAEALPWADMILTEDSAAIVKKPAYHSLKLLNGKIKNFTEIRSIPGGCAFTVEGKTVLVLWSETPATVDVSAHFSASSVQVTHIVTNSGNPAPVVHSSNASAVSIDREPVFVEQW